MSEQLNSQLFQKFMKSQQQINHWMQKQIEELKEKIEKLEYEGEELRQMLTMGSSQQKAEVTS